MNGLPRLLPLRFSFGAPFFALGTPFFAFAAFFAFLVLSALLPCAVRASDATGGLAGSVRRFDGHPIAGARVELDGPSRHAAISSADGTFAIVSLAAGTYLVHVTARGFAHSDESMIEVRAGDTASLQLFLLRSDAGYDTSRDAAAGRAAFPPAANGQSPIQHLRGITPSTLVAPAEGVPADTRGLEPTSTAHGLLSLDAGSFGQFGALVENTGTAGRLGYALALAREGAG